MLRENLLEFGKINIECVRAEAALFYKLIDILNQSNLTEHALIIESEPVIFFENKHSTRVSWCLFLVFEIAQRAGHAKVQPQPAILIHAHKQMLAVTATRFEAMPF